MMTAVADPLDASLQATAQLLFDVLRKRVVSRRQRVVLLASATRQCLDALPIEQRGPGYVARTWALPPSTEALRFLQQAITQNVSIVEARTILLARATQIAIHDLSPDEQVAATAEVQQIIGSSLDSVG